MQSCVLSCFRHVQLFVTLWTLARQASLTVRSEGSCIYVKPTFPTCPTFPSQALVLLLHRTVSLLFITLHGLLGKLRPGAWWPSVLPTLKDLGRQTGT